MVSNHVNACKDVLLTRPVSLYLIISVD